MLSLYVYLLILSTTLQKNFPKILYNGKTLLHRCEAKQLNYCKQQTKCGCDGNQVFQHSLEPDHPSISFVCGDNNDSFSFIVVPAGRQRKKGWVFILWVTKMLAAFFKFCHEVFGLLGWVKIGGGLYRWSNTGNDFCAYGFMRKIDDNGIVCCKEISSLEFCEIAEHCAVS